MIELVALLGNPGREYANTRHNAAWLLGKNLPFFDEISWRKKFKGLSGDIETGKLLAFGAEKDKIDENSRSLPNTIHFLMPETYMNNSGEAVRAAADFYKIPLERILVVHDELELPQGYLSLKYSGGLGGHNGLRSMNAHFGGPDFWRLRIGIGRPNNPDVYTWVLSAFTAQELETLEPVLTAGAELLRQTLLRDPETLLSEWKKKRIERGASNSA